MTTLHEISHDLATMPEIETTTLNEKQMAGFAEGFAMAAHDPFDEMTQRAFDLAIAFVDPDCPDIDVAIGRFIGYVRHFEELLCRAEEAEVEELLLATCPEEVH